MRRIAKRLTTKNGYTVGFLEGNVLRKKAKDSIHRFRAIGDLGSWGIDYDVLHSLPDTTIVEITEEEKFVLYRQNVGNIKKYGVIKHFKEGEIDHYTQVFLPLEGWDRINMGPA